MLSRLGGGFLDIQTDRHTNIHTDRHYKRDRGITPVGMLSRLGGGHLDRQTDRQTDRHTRDNTTANSSR